MNPNSYSHQQRGFTLIEAIVVIVITGIIAGMVAIFIRAPVQTYMDVRDRADLADTASAALRKMRVDLRLALPNSIRVVEVDGVQYLELLLTKTGARYQSIDDGLAVGTATVPGELSFTKPDLTSFNYIGPALTGPQKIVPGDYVVVYNLGPGIAPADAYQGGNRALLTGVAVTVTATGTVINTLTMADNPYAQPGSFESPGHRFQVVTTAVTYRCAPAVQGGEVTRFWNYKIQQAQPTTYEMLTKQDETRPVALQITPKNALLAGDVRGCLFDYETPASQRSGVIGLRFSLAKAGGNVGDVTLFDQVHVDNTP
jgi:MSHA biogenesis protein MshO